MLQESPNRQRFFVTFKSVKKIELSAKVQLLDPRKGGYHYLFVDKEVVAQFPKQNKTRLQCTINDYTFPCGLNHLGNGHFFVILGKEKMKKSGALLNELVQFTLAVDPNPLGVEEPEVLSVLLDQDRFAKKQYNQLTDGKKRSLIFTLQKTKNLDLQVQKIVSFLEEQAARKR